MRQHYLIKLLLCCLLLSVQAANADNVVVFSETFDNTTGTGGHDGAFSGNIATNNIKYDGTTWSSSTKCGGAYQCVKFGNGSENGVMTTPAIALTSGTTAVLTFTAAGWDDSAKNKLTITGTGCTVGGDTDIELTPAEWNSYMVVISNAATGFTLTFTGKRGFLDDVVVENITEIAAPTLPSESLYWPQTTEAAVKTITLTPARLTTIHYTTDGTEPTVDNGTAITQTSNVTISGNATLKAIAYIGDVVSSVASRTYTVGSTVSGIAAFNALADGTEARLYIADDADARVLHGQQQEMYLRDNSGTLCLDFGTTAVFNPAPQHNQHVAGWIVGKKQTVNNLPKLVATENTTTDYLALAAPVTETATEPTAVAANLLSNHVGDWVTVSEAEVGDALQVSNSFDTDGYTEAYSGAIVDVSGIVTAAGVVSPVYYDNILPIVYVIDENKAFKSPDSDIEGATVRLTRKLGKDYWNTFVVPFDITTFAGEIRENTGANGNTLLFGSASGMVAGKPYLVKPTADIENPVFSNVTLSADAAQSIVNGDYAFVGIYGPQALATDRTMMFLRNDGNLYFPTTTGNTLKGMRAYFKVPAGQGARLFFGDGDMTTGIDMAGVDGSDPYKGNMYNLNGQRVTTPGKGLYIVNGKKIVIR